MWSPDGLFGEQAKHMYPSSPFQGLIILFINKYLKVVITKEINHPVSNKKASFSQMKPLQPILMFN